MVMKMSSRTAAALARDASVESSTAPLVQLRAGSHAPTQRAKLLDLRWQPTADAPFERAASRPKWRGFAEHVRVHDPIAGGLFWALARDFVGNPYDATDGYRQWLDLETDVSRYEIVTGPDMVELVVHHRAPANRGGICPRPDDLLERLHAVGGLPVVHGTGLVYMVARAAFLRGELEVAARIVDDALAQERHFVLETAAFALDKARHGDLPPFLEDVFGDKSEFFRDRVCRKPFTEFQVDTRGDVYICCPSYLNLPVGNIRTESYEAILNSPMAVKIRRSILDGTYRYCSRSACPAIRGNALQHKDDSRHDADMRQYIDNASGVVDRAHFVHLSIDSTCNLSCPSCRNEKIAEKPETVNWKLEATDNVLLPMLERADMVMMSGNGDVFMSKPCRRILERVSRQTHPRLRFEFITNGVLFDEKMWNSYPNIHDMVASVRVSVDAATESTYASVRRGGDFPKLRSNLEFLADLHRRGVFETFYISMVYQHENMHEMAAFAQWAQALDCTGVIFEPLLDWNAYPRGEYDRRAVHLPSHPDHAEFRRLLDDPALRGRHIIATSWY